MAAGSEAYMACRFCRLKLCRGYSITTPAPELCSSRHIKWLVSFSIWRRTTSPPLRFFTPSMWSGAGDRVTNNGAEAFHRHFGDLFGYLRCNPTVWHFLRNLKILNVLKDVKLRSSRAEADSNSATEVAHHLELYNTKKITSRALLYTLCKKNQPKIKKNSRKWMLCILQLFQRLLIYICFLACCFIDSHLLRQKFFIKSSQYYFFHFSFAFPVQTLKIPWWKISCFCRYISLTIYLKPS